MDEEDFDMGQGGFDSQLQDDLNESDQFKDDLVPLALEYYLGVIEQPDPEDEGDEDEDSDGDKPAPSKDKKGKKGNGGEKGGEAEAGEGAKEDCKQ